MEGEESELEPILKMAFSFIKADLDINKEKWENTCKARSEAGKKGGRPPKAKKAKGFSEKQTKAKKADSVNDSVSDSVSEHDNEHEHESETDNKKQTKKSFGEFQHIKLTETHLEKLKLLYGDKTQEAINILDSYIESTGKKYKNHYAVLGEHNWVYKKMQENKKSTRVGGMF